MTTRGDSASSLRRRRLLTLLGGSGLAAVAGCFGGDDPADDAELADGGQTQTDDPDSGDDSDQGGDGGEQTDVSCPEWSDLERVDLAEYGVADFPVIPSYPVGWEENTAFIESDEGILAVADPDRQPDNLLDYVSIQVRLIDADGDVPTREEWPTRDWMQANDEADPVEFEGEERPVGFFEAEVEAIWEFTAAGPNDTHMLVNVIVRFASEACLDGMLDLGRAVLDTLERNDDSSI